LNHEEIIVNGERVAMMLTCPCEHVEEKNNSVIHTFMGYDRDDSQGEESLLNRLYLALHLMVDWFLPS
jgi:hypothetical protein